MGTYPGIDGGSLERLRALARELHQENGRAVPLDRLVELASEVRLDAGVTIDLDASRDLGQPLVVLRMAPSAVGHGPLVGLSPRELEVAALVADGLSNKRIAHRLAIGLGTVKDHVHRILQKSSLSNRAAIAVAYRAGLDAPDHAGPE
jgi:DNA-binding NarL/FixJ family response regulator